ncbi:hypothetical protein LOTGIDRAFT_231745 [Lottia gigantea]|uniref:C-type lectin domain-containing protein n=1 Tax=Lottia gigantea TaxID=225164 RepID=V4AQA4_LOTGI|nr:hypothetical protein LOTGIDRAFT_231745 [Lottia gigantea]ESO96990.1 hypothetical protein LOTGIDRAFT_231745 [Lottia gigantea]
MGGGFHFFVFCCVCLLVEIKAVDPPLCDSDWEANDIYCYYFNNGDNRTWQHAIEACEAKQAQLVRIESADELSFLKRKFQGYPAADYWTALNQLKTDGDGATGTWLWGTDEYPDFSIVKWNKEPDNSNDEDCGAISIQATFSDEQCSSTLPYICETDISSSFECPSYDWTEGEKDCFLVSNYTDTSQFLTWQQANAKCTSMSTSTATVHLMTFDVDSDSDILSKTLPFYNTDTRYWTGLNDIDQEGQYIWVWKTGPTYNPQNIKWTQEPDNLAGREWCATATQEGTFSDRDCNKAFNFVCRKPQASKSDTHDFGCGQWSRAGHKCYEVYNAPKSSWADARAACQKLSGDLVKIESEDELRYMTMQSAGQVMDQGTYWIGLNDQSTEGTYVWADGTEADSSLINWEISPRNAIPNQHCAGINRDGTKMDFPCTVFQLGYVCEKPMDKSENCPNSWSLYNYNCYFLSVDLTDRETALSICKRKKGKLLAVNDAQEMQYVMSLVGDIDTWPNMWWIGLNDKIVNGQWTYPDDSDNWSGVDGLIPWSTEPNNYNGNEDCVSIEYSGGMNDAGCDRLKGFICEKSSPGPAIFHSKWLLCFTSLYLMYIHH